MKLRALIFLALFSVPAFAAQDAIILQRTFKNGESDNYNLNVTIGMPGNVVDMKMALTQTVKKVYDNGDADIETASNSVKLFMNGQEMPANSKGDGKTDQKETRRFDKYLRPVPGGSAKPAQGLMNRFGLLLYGVMLSGQPVKKGDIVPVSYEDKDSKTSVEGTAKVVDIAGGYAQIQSTFKVKTPETNGQPVDLNMTSKIDTATTKPSHVEATVTSLPAAEGMKVDSIKFVLDRG